MVKLLLKKLRVDKQTNIRKAGLITMTSRVKRLYNEATEVKVMVYQNLLTGEYNVPHKINKWFSDFLDSFKESEYHAQEGRLKPWQYKGLMKLVESNHWRMLSEKQWDIFCKYIRFEEGTYEKFAKFVHNGRKFAITISDSTGFVTIKISG